MKKKNEISPACSYVFNQKEKNIYLKTFIRKSVAPQSTYDRTRITGNHIHFEIIYKKQHSTGTAVDYKDTSLIKLNIPVPDMEDYGREKIREIIRKYLNKQSVDGKIHLKIIFLKPDGSEESKTIKGISEDADIDLTY